MGAQLTQVGRRPRACCNEALNIRTETVDDKRRIEYCTACGARHHIMSVDPVPLGVGGCGLG